MDAESTRQCDLFSDLLDKPMIAKFDPEHASAISDPPASTTAMLYGIPSSLAFFLRRL